MGRGNISLAALGCGLFQDDSRLGWPEKSSTTQQKGLCFSGRLSCSKDPVCSSSLLFSVNSRNPQPTRDAGHPKAASIRRRPLGRASIFDFSPPACRVAARRGVPHGCQMWASGSFRRRFSQSSVPGMQAEWLSSRRCFCFLPFSCCFLLFSCFFLLRFLSLSFFFSAITTNGPTSGVWDRRELQ